MDGLQNSFDGSCGRKIGALRRAFKQLYDDYQKLNCTCNSWREVKEACRSQRSTVSSVFHGCIGFSQTV